MPRDPLNRVVSPLGERLQKQKDAITRFEHREQVLSNALATWPDDPAEVVSILRQVLNGDWDDPALS